MQERPCGLDRRNRDEQRDGRGRRVANVRVSVQGKGLFAWAWASWAAATHVSFDATAQFEGQFLDLENAIRHSLKSFGIRLSKVGRGAFEQAVREATAGDALTAELMDAMLKACGALWKEYCLLHELVVKFVARSKLARRLMAIPGVGPVTALSFISAIDETSRFRRSRDVAAYFGLTSGSRAHRSTFKGASRRLEILMCDAHSTKQPRRS